MKAALEKRYQDYRIATADLCEEVATGRILNLANFLTLLRLALIVPMSLLLPNRAVWAKLCSVLIVLIAVLSDIVDGLVAKRLNQVTAWGRILDPIVDKTVAGVMLFLLYRHREFPLWAVLFFLPKDLLIVCGAYFLICSHKRIPAPRYLGACSVLLLAVAVCFYILDMNMVGLIWLILASSLAMLVLLDYAIRTR